MAGLCQDCTECCKVLEVKEIGKSFHEPCRFLGPSAGVGLGCTIYNDRPLPCQHYVCLWLDSRRRVDVEDLPDKLKPNACHVVMGWPWGEERDTLYVYPSPGYDNAWRVPPVSDYLRLILSRGAKVVIVMQQGRIAIKGDMAIIGTEEEFERLTT